MSYRERSCSPDRTPRYRGRHRRDYDDGRGSYYKSNGHSDRRSSSRGYNDRRGEESYHDKEIHKQDIIDLVMRLTLDVVICYQCKIPGHKVKYCPNKQAKKLKPVPPPGKSNLWASILTNNGIQKSVCRKLGLAPISARTLP